MRRRKAATSSSSSGSLAMAANCCLLLRTGRAGEPRIVTGRYVSLGLYVMAFYRGY